MEHASDEDEPKGFLKDLLAFYSDIDGNANKVNKSIYVMNKCLDLNNVDFTKLMAWQFPLAAIDEDMDAHHRKLIDFSWREEALCQSVEHHVQLSS